MIARHPVVCANGYVMSVQASRMHYSTPRKNDAEKYSEVECSLSEPPFPGPAWHALSSHKSGDNIYAYVPIQLVLDLIQENGGMRSGDMPPSPACFKARIRWAKLRDDEE